MADLMEALADFLPFLSRGCLLQRARIQRSFSMLQAKRGWGLKFGIAPLRQIGYPGPRLFSPMRDVVFTGELPLWGVGVRAQIDGGYYWANFINHILEG